MVEETCTEEEAFQLAERDEKVSMWPAGKILNVIMNRRGSNVAS